MHTVFSPYAELPERLSVTVNASTTLTVRVRRSSRARRLSVVFDRRTGELELVVPAHMTPQDVEAWRPNVQRYVTSAWKAGKLRAQPPTSLPETVSFALADNVTVTARVCLSRRVQRMRLSVDRLGGLQLTVPPDVTPDTLKARLPSFLPWLQTAWDAGSLAPQPTPLPESIFLPFLGKRFGVSLPEHQQTDPSTAAQVLQRWCRHMAQVHLPGYVQMLAAQGGFALARVTVRDQRTRWGSCSRRNSASGEGEGSISLNWRAILLSVPLLQHLCWHELCHLRQMNHSAAYHAELARYSPDWMNREKALTDAWRTLPWWALPLSRASGA